MADEKQKEYTSTRGLFKGGAINVPKRLFNTYIADWWTYYRTSDRDLPITQTPLIEALITVLRSRISDLRDTEIKFNAIESMYKLKVEEIYKGLANYTTQEVVNNELQMIKYGTGFEVLKIEIKGEPFPYRIPSKMALYFPDGSIQYPRYYGRETASIFATELMDTVNKIVNHVIGEINKPDKTDEQKKALIEQMEVIRREADKWIGSAMRTGEKGESAGDIYGIYNRWKGKLDEFNQVIGSEIEGLWAEIVNKRVPEHVVYRHTYHQVIKQTVDKKGKIKKLTLTSEFDKKAGEVDLGLDDLGMPLEVAGPEGYTFIDKEGNKSPNYPCGTVLIDIFEKHDTDKSAAYRLGVKVRRVDPIFVARMELLDVVSYIHNAWDEYRDDLRDGRYHPYSRTVSDYIMAASKAVGGEWGKKIKPRDVIESYTEYEMQLRGNPPWDKKISNIRRPSNLNPAFDLRVLEKGFMKYKGEKKQWRHIGKKRYYGSDGDVCKWEQKEPHISSRGASMFIIEEVCRKGKIAQEIHQDLISIAKRVNGFDYGPRIFADQEFCMDPFNINYSKVNQKRMEKLAGKGAH